MKNQNNNKHFSIPLLILMVLTFLIIDFLELKNSEYSNGIKTIVLSSEIIIFITIIFISNIRSNFNKTMLYSGIGTILSLYFFMMILTITFYKNFNNVNQLMQFNVILTLITLLLCFLIYKVSKKEKD